MKQVAPGATVKGNEENEQLPRTTEKSAGFAPPIVSDVTCMAVLVDGFVSVIFATLLVLAAPIAAGPRNNGPGVTIRAAPGPVTKPDIGIVCGLSAALSVTTSEAVRVPVAVAEGLKAMLTEHPICPRGTGVVQPLEVIWKSAAFGSSGIWALPLTVSATSPSLSISTELLVLVVPAA